MCQFSVAKHLKTKQKIPFIVFEKHLSVSNELQFVGGTKFSIDSFRKDSRVSKLLNVLLFYGLTHRFKTNYVSLKPP